MNYDRNTKWSTEAKIYMSSLFKVNQVFTVNKLHYEAKTGHYKIDLLNKHGESLNKNLKKLLKKVENKGAE